MTAAIHHSTIAALWPRVRAALDRLTAMVGAPAVIAALSFTSLRARRALVRELTRVELYVRKLLIAEAALFEPATHRGPNLVEIPLRGVYAPTNQTKRHPASAARPAADLERPEAWRVSFRLALPRDRRGVPHQIAPRVRALWGVAPPPSAPRQAPPRHLSPSAVRIARRVEALRRVLNDPAPHARRLARAHRTISARNPTALASYAFTTPRRHCVDHHDLRLDVDIYAASWIAHANFANTS